jgi:hypothetical protein
MEDAYMEGPADPVDDKKKSFDKVVQTRAQKQKQQSGNH